MPFDYEAAISALEVKHAQDVFKSINLTQLQIPNNDVVKFATIAISAGVLADLMQRYIQPTEGCCFGWMYLRRHNIHYAKEIHSKALEVKNAVVSPLSYDSKVNLEHLNDRVNQVLQAINAPFDPTTNPAKINPVGDFAMALTPFLNKYWQIRYPVTYTPPTHGGLTPSVASKKRFGSVRKLLPSMSFGSKSSKNSIPLSETSELLSGPGASPVFRVSYANQLELKSMIELCDSIAFAQTSPGIMPNTGDQVWAGHNKEGLILSKVVQALPGVGRY